MTLPAPPKTSSKHSQSVFVELTDADRLRLELLCDKHNRSMSFVVRELIRDAYVREGLGQMRLSDD